MSAIVERSVFEEFIAKASERQHEIEAISASTMTTTRH